MQDLKIGFGTNQPKWVLHIANRPELEGFQHDVFRDLAEGEAAQIIKSTSNHWRKVFSIMAKISFALFDTGCSTWQEYRDSNLLTNTGFEAINFESYEPNNNYFSIICGFNYAETQVNLASFVSHYQFEKLKIAEKEAVLVTPYFDWRQLNNELLAVVIDILANKLRA